MTIRLIIILLPHSPSIEGGAPPREGVHPVPQGDPEALTLERRVGLFLQDSKVESRTDERRKQKGSNTLTLTT